MLGLKKTNIRLFGIKVFEKEEICADKQYEDEIIQVNVTQDYFDKEFKVDNNKDDNC